MADPHAGNFVDLELRQQYTDLLFSARWLDGSELLAYFLFEHLSAPPKTRDGRYDRLMKANTVKTRTHSLFRQGTYWFSRIPTMPVEKLAPLLRALEAQLTKHPVFKQVFGAL